MHGLYHGFGFVLVSQISATVLVFNNVRIAPSRRRYPFLVRFMEQAGTGLVVDTFQIYPFLSPLLPPRLLALSCNICLVD